MRFCWGGDIVVEKAWLYIVCVIQNNIHWNSTKLCGQDPGVCSSMYVGFYA